MVPVKYMTSVQAADQALQVFTALWEADPQRFVEENGRKLFLLYI